MENLNKMGMYDTIVFQKPILCENCSKYFNFYIAVKYEIYLGVFDSYSDAQKEIDMFGVLNILNYYKKLQKNKLSKSSKKFMKEIVEHFDEKKESHFVYDSYFKNAKTPIEVIKNYLKESKLEDLIRSTYHEKSELEISYKKENDKVLIYNKAVQKYLSTPSTFIIINSLQDKVSNYNNGEISVQETITQNIIVDEIQKWMDFKNIPLKVIILSNHIQNRGSFIDDIVNIYKKYNLSLGHEDTEGSFKIENFSEENIDWIKEALLYEGKF